MATVAAMVHIENTSWDKQVTAKLTCSVAWLNKSQSSDGHQQTLFCLDQPAYITIPGVFTCVPNQTVPRCFPYTKRDSTKALYHTATVRGFLGLSEQSGSSWLLQWPPVPW